MITVAGLSPSLDLTYLLPTLRLGEIQRTSQVVRCAGGKPLNMARAATTLGGAVTVVALLGGPTGEQVAQLLAETSLELVTVSTPYETRTCVSIASAETGDLTEVYQNAAPVPSPVWAAFATSLGAQLTQRPGWLVVNGAVPAGLDPAAIAGVITAAQRGGIRVAVDTHGPGLSAAVQARPDVVKINRIEASTLLNAAPTDDLMTMAAEIQLRTDGLVVLTDGRRAVAAVDGHRRLRADLPPASGHYPVGSGDSFLGGLVVELDRGAPTEQGLRTAVAAGVANTLVPGPGNLAPGTVARLARQVRLSAADA